MYDQVKDARAQDSGFCFLCNHLCFSIFRKLVRQSCFSPYLFLKLLRVEWNARCTKNSYKICLDFFPVTLLLNQKRFYKKRSYLDKLNKNLTWRYLNKNQWYRESLWKFKKQSLTWEKKSNNLYDGNMWKGILGPRTWVLGAQSWVPGPGFWVLNLGSQVPSLECRVLGPYFRLCSCNLFKRFIAGVRYI